MGRACREDMGGASFSIRAWPANSKRPRMAESIDLLADVGRGRIDRIERTGSTCAGERRGGSPAEVALLKATRDESASALGRCRSRRNRSRGRGAGGARFPGDAVGKVSRSITVRPYSR